MKKLFALLLFVSTFAFGQSYPSPTYNVLTLQTPLAVMFGGTGVITSTGSGATVLNTSPTLITPTVTGSFTATGLVTLQDLATQAANTILGNATGSTASPTAITVTGCNGAAQALQWTNGSGFGCNSAVIAANVSGTVAIANGGTNASTATGATSNLQYLQGATSSGARSLTNKFQDSTSVLDFTGVDPTGATDSTTGIRAAITAMCAKSTAGTLLFPPGVYNISGQLAVACNYLNIAGSGVLATQIISSATAANIFAFTGLNDGLSGAYIGYSSAATAGAAVSLSAANNFVMANVAIANAFQGLSIVNSGSQYFTNLSFTNTTAATGVTIFINGGQDQFFSNIISNNPSGSQPLAGFQIAATGAVWIDGADIIHSGTGMLVNPTSGNTVTYLFVSNSAFDTNSNVGINIVPGAGATAYGLTFTGTWTASSTNAGVVIGSSGTTNGVRFVGHRSFNNGTDGYLLPGGATTNISFNDCDASGNSQTSIGTSSGFNIAAGVSSFSITNSRSGPEAGFANTQSRGILINAGASNNYVLTGNNVQGNVNASIVDGGTGTSKIVKGNLGYNPLGITGIGVNASPTSFTNNTGDTVSVLINAGVVTAITVGGLTVGVATNAEVTVPQGQTVTVTYSSAPVMNYLGH